MADFRDVLGLSVLPPPADGGGAASIGPIGSSGAGRLNGPLTPLADVSVAGPPLAISPPAQSDAPIDFEQIIGRQLPGLLRPPQTGGFNMPTFLASLGAGLSSAGQNWNKPAAAAFAGGAGAAIQGGQQAANQQQDAKLKALQTAIAAWKVGDLAAYRQALLDLRAASATGRAQAQSAPAAAAPVAATPVAPTPAPPAPSPPGTSTGPTLYGNPTLATAGTPRSAAAGSPSTAAADAFAQARDAIARGAPPDAVQARLREYGFDPLPM